MSLWKRLFTPRDDGRAALRPLWARIVAAAREPEWYAAGGVADTMAGRFDVITLVLAAVILRLEAGGDALGQAARLTELFIEDIEGQMRQSGVGDPSVGKRMGKLVAALGGRIGALRSALAEPGDGALITLVERNVTFGDAAQPALVSARLRALSLRLAAMGEEALLDAETL